MSNKNLFKAAFNKVNEQDIMVIDSNVLLEKKIKEANAALNKHTDEIPVDMVDGMDAFTVANLLEESGIMDLNEEEASVGEEEQPFRSNIIKAVSPKESPAIREAEKEIEERLEGAKEEAERIIGEAYSQADAVRRAAREEGKKEGYDEGYANGLAQMVEKEQELKNKEELLEKEYQRKIDELEPQFIETLSGIYEHIFQVDLSEHRDIIVHLLSNTIRKIEGSKDFIVHVSRDDYPYVNMQKKQISACVSIPNATVEIIEDFTLTRNECMIETEGGIYDCGLGTELRELTAKLRLLSYEKK